ncbi:MAG TPA: AAA family ATPase [Polyangiales bacterium]|nr:AAA family ATPase [Polyangiales bacterium]
MAEALQIRLLGEQELVRGDVALTLPPSRKTRALLAYLVLSRRPVRRDRLCELLWDVADDPRAALRWSLSKLRELVDSDGHPRLLADRESVRLALDDVRVDVFEVQKLTQRPLAELPTAELEGALEAFRGELLEGLELPDFHAYYAFCLSERASLQRLQTEILNELIARHPPERALGYARRLVELDPSEGARAQFQRLLQRSAEPLPARVVRVLEAAPFVGRAAELAELRTWLSARTPRVFTLEGEAGLGKSTLVARFVSEAEREGVRVLRCAARELDRGSPYAGLQPLFAALGVALELDAVQRPADEGEEQRALARRLQALLEKLPDCVIVLEDLHWFDRMSAELTYRLAGQRGCLVITLRPGELVDNAHARRCLAAIRELPAHESLVLAPLSHEETLALLPGVTDVARIHRESAGNPLYALELARADGSSGSLAALVRTRLEGLPSVLQDVLRWAALLGVELGVDRLQSLVALEPESFVEALEQLARLGFLQLEHDRARFAHEVVARAIYDGLSGPRRRLMHARVSRQTTDAAELAHHALLAGDTEAAVRACIAAGHRCLGLLASAEALALAQRGLGYVRSLPQPSACVLELDLQELSLLARRPQDPEAFAARLGELAVQALAMSELACARRGFYLQAFLQWERGEVVDTRRYSREAERCSRLSEPGERVRALADASHCLIALERDLTDAQAFVSEAEALIASGQPDIAGVSLCRGAMELYRGDYQAAEQALTHASERARVQQERLIEFFALEWLAELELARGVWTEERVTLMVALGETRAGSEAPFARALRTLIRHANGRAQEAELVEAMAALETADSKHRQARLLLHWAELLYARGQRAQAAERAREALALAERVERGSELMIARALLLQCTGEGREQLESLHTGSARALALRAKALSEA